MMMKKNILILLAFLCLNQATFAQWAYPETRKTDQSDEYFGVKVADPYRWLEDDNSEETAAWVKAQNEVTFGFLESIAHRGQWMEALEKVYNYPRYSTPFRKAEWVYFYKNDGLQNQSVLYRQKGFDGNPEVVIDPNELRPTVPPASAPSACRKMAAMPFMACRGPAPTGRSTGSKTCAPSRTSTTRSNG